MPEKFSAGLCRLPQCRTPPRGPPRQAQGSAPALPRPWTRSRTGASKGGGSPLSNPRLRSRLQIYSAPLTVHRAGLCRLCYTAALRRTGYGLGVSSIAAGDRIRGRCGFRPRPTRVCYAFVLSSRVREYSVCSPREEHGYLASCQPRGHQDAEACASSEQDSKAVASCQGRCFPFTHC